MNRREEDQQNRRRQENRGGNRDMGQDRESMYRGAYRFDDHRTTRDQYGDRHDNHRDDRGQADQRNTMGASRNYGNMGSYGGAQGYGSSRGGNGHRNEDRSGFDATSGHGRDTVNRPGHERQVYGAYWDKNSFSNSEHNRFADQHRAYNPDENRNRGYQSDRDREDDSRYEIYDNTQSQYNRGMYGNYSEGSVSDNFHQNIDDDYRNQDRDYDTRQRARNRQGSGNNQDRNFGTNMSEGNNAGSLSWGYDGSRGYPDDNRNNRYNPMTGGIRRDNLNDREREQRRQQEDWNRGGYNSNNRNPDERNQNR